MTLPVTLQINLVPRDFRFARYVLPHQFRQWGGQVAEILLVIESRRSRGTFGHDWKEGMEALLPLAHSIPNARVLFVDYSTRARRKVGTTFFGGRGSIPAKDVRGGPYYCYFYGLAEAAHDLVFHIDSDIFFGGGSQTWIAEAVQILQDHPEIVSVEPLPGPPDHFGKIEGCRDPAIQSISKVENGESMLILDGFSTRNFLLDRKNLGSQIGPLKVVLLSRDRPVRRFIKRLLGKPAEFRPVQLPEVTIADTIRQRGFCRIGYLGRAPGMWSLHPPDFPFDGYFETLPTLISRIENGDIPEGQRGLYDMNDSMRIP